MRPAVPYILLGERCSGTNIIEKVITCNSPFRPDWSLAGFKHFPRHTSPFDMPGIHDRPAILVVREPFSWLRSFYREPWHAAPSLKSMTFSDFLRSEWHSVWDVDTYTPSQSDQYLQEMLLDRDRCTGERYKNVIALRSGKLRHMLEILSQSRSTMIVRLEDYQLAPRETVCRLLSTLGCPLPNSLSIPSGYKADTTRISQLLSAVGLSSLYRSRARSRHGRDVRKIPTEDLAFIRNSLDPALEASVGYPLP